MKSELKKLCQEYIMAKARENAAKENRLAAESALLTLISPSKLEGTETKATDGFKIIVTSKLNRTLNYGAYQELYSGPRKLDNVLR